MVMVFHIGLTGAPKVAEFYSILVKIYLRNSSKPNLTVTLTPLIQGKGSDSLMIHTVPVKALSNHLEYLNRITDDNYQQKLPKFLVSGRR